MRILVLNSGSSSLKFHVTDVSSDKSESPLPVLSGSVTGIGGAATVKIKGASGPQPTHPAILTYDDAVGWIVEQIDCATIQAVGHRGVHGGESFTQRGVSGLSHDMQELLRAEQGGHLQAALAIALFCYRVRKYIGAYFALLNGAEAIVFGGGIGEHAPVIRERICNGMEWCGIGLGPERNARVTDPQPVEVQLISSADAGISAYVVGVDEEAVIAGDSSDG